MIDIFLVNVTKKTPPCFIKARLGRKTRMGDRISRVNAFDRFLLLTKFLGECPKRDTNPSQYYLAGMIKQLLSGGIALTLTYLLCYLTH